ncbi:cryptochrome/photolyase family protein [Nisaea sp.]|uniref:cryptochrome/photolyase family protein n=1 Tax=Nisaea sp. TaxID=2024842 RepID=UPI003B516BE6
MAGALVLVLGDQLSPALSALEKGDKERDRILMAEVAAETVYVRHHKKKIAFLFAAMRHFADELRSAGWTVEYVPLDHPDNSGTLGGEVARFVAAWESDRVLVTEPGEWRLQEEIGTWEKSLGCEVVTLPDSRFLASHEEFSDWAEGRKQLRMEYFYREMRRKTGLLMEGDKPLGGKWNFDAENRKPASADLFMPEPLRTAPDVITRDVLDLVRRHFADHFGDLEPFWFAVTRKGAEAAFEQFVADALPRFGDFQDAMLAGEKFLFHGVVGLYINAGLLDPLAVCRRVERAYLDGDVPLNAAEGFIRQIIGWREFVRGIYWSKMPDYAQSNHFGAERALPDFYWTAETDMACLAATIGQTKEEAYAHHIQRLMVTGNFAMLAGIDPHQVHEWYLAVYADAYEWVEMPNTLGMSQYADGGVLASKPYAAGGNYINRMSDYCRGCRFDVKKKTGKAACPFNYLYWDFLARNRDALDGNPRLGPVYRTWDRMAEEKRQAYRDSAEAFLSCFD